MPYTFLFLIPAVSGKGVGCIQVTNIFLCHIEIESER